MPHTAVVYIFSSETIGPRNAYIVYIVMWIFYGSESAIKQGSQRRVRDASCRRRAYILRKKLLPQKYICSAYSNLGLAEACLIRSCGSHIYFLRQVHSPQKYVCSAHSNIYLVYICESPIM